MNHCVLVTVLELASGKPIFFPWDISKYVPALSKVPLFLFPGTVTLGSNNHSRLETVIESKICTFYFLLSNIAKILPKCPNQDIRIKLDSIFFKI